MNADSNKKSARTFQCRDVLWETFEHMARELECSVDYLVNEAMKQYAKQRNQSATRTPYPGGMSLGDASQPAGPPLSPNPTSSQSLGSPTRPPIRANATAQLPPPPGRLPPPPPLARSSVPMPMPPPRAGASQAPQASAAMTAPGAAPAAASMPVGPPPAMRGGNPLPPPPAARSATPLASTVDVRGAAPATGSRMVPTPLQSVSPRVAPPPPVHANGFPAPQGATLTLVYNGERYPITKDRFVIGRGKQSSDLTLKDPNVSRQHALIEFQSGVYFMVDMGSTNGVSYNGERLARKPIAEGDVFRICDHDLAFTYR